MVSQQEFESFSRQIADPRFDVDTPQAIHRLIGHLDFDTRDAILAVAAEIVRQRGAVIESLRDGIEVQR